MLPIVLSRNASARSRCDTPSQKDLADVVPDLAWHGVDARLDGRGLQGDKQLLAAGRALADDADLSQEPKLVVTPGNVEGERSRHAAASARGPGWSPEAQEETRNPSSTGRLVEA